MKDRLVHMAVFQAVGAGVGVLVTSVGRTARTHRAAFLWTTKRPWSAGRIILCDNQTSELARW